MTVPLNGQATDLMASRFYSAFFHAFKESVKSSYKNRVSALPWLTGRGGEEGRKGVGQQQNLRKSCSSPCLLGKKQHQRPLKLLSTLDSGLEDRLSQALEDISTVV